MKFPVSNINQVKRGAKKASYDKKQIYEILDQCEICYVAFLHEGKAMVQPINFGRLNDCIYLHGSHQNRMTTSILQSVEVCLNVTILDAMKLTRSAFHHSVNYRSVNIFGTVKEMLSDEEKLRGLQSIINHFVPNRWDHCRPPTRQELDATKVLEINITSASAKIANTKPGDNKSDLSLDYWAGTLPVQIKIKEPIPDEFMDENSLTPDHVVDFIKKFNQRC
ncbi:MAG: pyridoxamine 5'-phosphate oxidase family protein [Saprospiraceae bacterium]